MSELTKPSRITSIDALRGLVIVIMALDHCRDFFGDLRINTEDPATTTWALFTTRWVTHFCAPTFVFLAGISAWLYGEKIESRFQLSRFLFTRGVWLIFLEFTVIYFSLALSFGILPWMFLVIAAIGTSMIALSVLCWLPTRAVLAVGLIIVLGHNLLDNIHADVFGGLGWVWSLIHDGPCYVPEMRLEIGYPVLAWIGVMCLGFGLAPIFKLPSEKRSRILVMIGLTCIFAFGIVRGIDGYGNPQHWSSQPTAAESVSLPSNETESFSLSQTAFSFLRAKKYPPSLAFLLMTLGPALVVLGWFDRLRDDSRVKSALLVFGKVPLFFYVVHFYVIHLGSIATYRIFKGVWLSPFQAIYGQIQGRELPPEFGFQTLWQVYVAWGGVVLLMYPLCAAYGRFKKSAKHPIWSYL